ncbi:hypothetical protein [Hydrotalea sandarakina]|jgi:hypothetical protein|uniref:Parallel beta helix pectate lyase-like protein n=1 Tax=Hydrotalea sandarakina TaxID=1004304 RepID=A0A2W7RXY1_9BACT|nr:hypothetical protein [Hydrotalea sandarakina]PZX65673.1 hypothetical protein LX80_00163 [Hydrotalea sandarakina]
MKNIYLFILSALSLALIASGCKKITEEHQDIYKYVPPPPKPISDSVPLCGSISGTMLAGKTYYVNCDIYVNAGDSLVIQPGVKVYFRNHAGLIVKGNLFSLGTQSNPIWLTVEGQTKTDNPVVNYSVQKDSAFNGIWKGIIGDVTCQYMILKWTHLEYCGALAGANGSGAYAIAGLKTTDNCYAVYFSNGNGYLVIEDSWVYGTVDDALRIGGQGGKIAILRSTFEKCGKTGGDILNIKAGGVGDMAYNMFIGGATNSLKAANSGIAPGLANCEVNVYNNTIVNSGYRQTKTGRGGSINYENGARGKVFNNLIVNCKFGLRLNTNVPDTAYMYNNNYGYNYYWADSLSVANEIFPEAAGSVTKPVATDFPNPFTYLPANYKYIPNQPYDGSKAVQVGNPMFVNYPLPVKGGYRLQDITAIGNFNFNLQPTSPCIGKGYTGFSPMAVVPVDPKYGVTTYSMPGRDIGCYQFNGTGNLH